MSSWRDEIVSEIKKYKDEKRLYMDTSGYPLNKEKLSAWINKHDNCDPMIKG